MFRLPVDFIDLLKKKYNDRRRPTRAGKAVGYSIPNLVISISYFIEDSLEESNPELYRHYKSRLAYKGYNKDNIYRIVNHQSTQWQPSKEFTDLLCYYAFDKCYEDAVEEGLLHDNRLNFYALKAATPFKVRNPPKNSLKNQSLAIDIIRKNKEIEQSILEKKNAQFKNKIDRLKELIRGAADAEMQAYKAVPDIITTGLLEFFEADSPAFNMVYVYLVEYKQKKLILTNPNNPTEHKIYEIILVHYSENEATFETVEYWLLRWYNVEKSEYPSRETYKVKNRQTYTLVNCSKEWKIRSIFFPEYDNC